MPSFEEEAFERARRMSHSRQSSARREEVRAVDPPKPKPEPVAEPDKSEPVVQKPAPNMMETLFRDKEKSLILLLLLLLSDENNDPSLLFALMYLLI